MLSFENIAYINLVIHLTGGLIAIFLYAGLGKIFWIPMSIDYIYWHVVGLFFDNIAFSIYFMFFMTVYRSLFLIWIFYLSGFIKSRWFIPLIFVLMILASFVSLLSLITFESLGEEKFSVLVGAPYHINLGQKWYLITLPLTYIWNALSFLVILGVILSSTALRWFRGQASNLLLDPKKRVLIPLWITSGIAAFSFLFQEQLSSDTLINYYDCSIQIASSLLGWGWVAMELPFYIMYRRMLKRYPEMVRRDQVDSYWKK